jgi:secreted Zn-dependent insulinase-like peptidase
VIISGLYYGVQLAKGGLEIYFQGYGHKLPVLVERAAEEIFRLSHDPSACSAELFHRIKDKQLRALKNLLYSQPYYHCVLGGLLCLEEPRWSNAEKYTALQGATLNGFVVFAAQFLAQSKLELLVNGNITVTEASELSQKINDILQTKPLPFSNEMLRRAVAIIPQSASVNNKEYVFRQAAINCNPNEVNSAVENLYFIGEGAGRIQAFCNNGNDSGLTAEEFDQRLVSEAMLELVLQLVRG